MTGRVDVLWRIVEIIARKLKLTQKSTIFKNFLSNFPKTMFFVPVASF